MKKIALLTLALLLIIPMFSQIRSAYAVSCGYERYVDDHSEVYVEYFPLFPYDPNYPTASEEFPIKFYINQDAYTENIGFTRVVPWNWYFHVFFRDDTTGDNNWISTWKRWYPTSVEQSGAKVSWSISFGIKYLGLSATVTLPTVRKINRNYDNFDWEHGGKVYNHLSYLQVAYQQSPGIGDTYVEGAGSIGIPNDLAMLRDGHHVQILVLATLDWMVWTLTPIGWLPTGCRRTNVYFVLGDDIPATTDCWLNVQQGDTAFSYVPPSNPGGGGGGGCPILSVWNGTDYFEEGLLDIHNSDGVDVTYEHTLVTTPQRENGAYLLRLTEHPQTHSYIDEVKLYAIFEDGTMKELPLIWAWHSEDGNVLPQLLHSDDWKADTLGADLNNGTSQSIDLKFAAHSPNLEIIGFVFEVEGNNRISKL